MNENESYNGLLNETYNRKRNVKNSRIVNAFWKR